MSYTRGDEGNHPVYTVQCVVETPHTVLKCESAEGAGADLTWTVVVDEQQSSTPVTNYATPTILGLSWTESAVVAGENGFTFIDGARGDGGELVTVHGENFGQQRHNGGVTYGPTGTEYVLRDVVVVNHTTLQGRTSPGIGVGHSFVVRVSGQASEASEATLSYAAPRIDSVRFCAAGASVCDESGDVATWSDPAAVPEVEVRGAHWGLLDTSSAVQIRLGNPTDGTLRPPITPTSVSPQPGDPGKRVCVHGCVHLRVYSDRVSTHTHTTQTTPQAVSTCCALACPLVLLHSAPCVWLSSLLAPPSLPLSLRQLS